LKKPGNYSTVLGGELDVPFVGAFLIAQLVNQIVFRLYEKVISTGDTPALEDCRNWHANLVPVKGSGLLTVPGTRITLDLCLCHRETTV
jgi:hypothetical protein